MALTVKHNKVSAIPDDPAAVTAGEVVPSDWNDDHPVTGTLDVANGGTGATSLTGYVKGNGAGAMSASATVPGSDVSGNISGNAANVTGTVAVANGGTGQTTANSALNALLPFQGSSAGDFLATNGTNTYWSPAPGGLVMYVEDSAAAVLPTVTGSGSIAAGDGGYAAAQYSIAISGYAGNGSALYSTAIGKSSSNNLAFTVASGALALSGAYASGVDSVAIATGGLYGAQSAGSYAIGYNAYAQHNYSFAIGNSAITSATNQIALGGPSDAVKISDAYTLPTSDGTSSQVLQTDGAGNVSWATAGGGSSALTIQNKTGAYTVVAGDLGTIINCTSGTFTVSLTAAATLGAGFNITIWNTGTGVITIDPNASETIDGLSTRKLYKGEGTQLVCTGSDWLFGNSRRYRGFAQNVGSGETAPTAVGDGATAWGYFVNANGANSTAGGYFATAGSNFSTAIGNNSAGNGSQAVTGSGAMALGGSYASGTDSFAAAVANNTSSYGATGANSIAIGFQAKASSTKSLCISTGSSVSSATESVAIGSNVTASGNYSFSAGYASTASVAYSVAIGSYAIANIAGKIALSGGAIAAAADSQSGYFVLRRGTTDATATTLNSGVGNPASGATNQVILPNNSAYAFTGIIVARQQAAGGTASAAWKIEGLIRREGSAGTTVLVNSSLTTIDNTPGWTLALSADTTNGGLAITATGAAATNIRWVATVQTSEVTYA